MKYLDIRNDMEIIVFSVIQGGFIFISRLTSPPTELYKTTVEYERKTDLICCDFEIKDWVQH